MRLSLNLHLMEHIWGGLYLNSEKWERHTGPPIWHVTYWWEVGGFDWVLSISFVRVNAGAVFRERPHTSEAGAAACCCCWLKTQQPCLCVCHNESPNSKWNNHQNNSLLWISQLHPKKKRTDTGASCSKLTKQLELVQVRGSNYFLVIDRRNPCVFTLWLQGFRESGMLISCFG